MKLEKNYDKSACGLAKIRSSHSLDFVFYDSSPMNLLFVFDDDNIELAVQGTLDCKFRCTEQTCVW